MTCDDDTMPKRSSKPKKRPRDVNALAAAVVQEATSENKTEKLTPEEIAHAAAVALGRLGGLKGGKARAKSMSRKLRVEAARRAANARWHDTVKD